MSSPEFQLTVECCRWAFAKDGAKKIHDLCADVDWVRFVRAARYHRVQGLVWNALWSVEAKIPTETARALASDTELIAATNLKAIAEMRELRAAFERAGLRLLFVKGLTLGALVYPKPMLKMGWDIDILVVESEVEKAAAQLIERGYRRMIPAASVDLATWHVGRKDSLWSKPEEGIHVELHTRLTENRQLISGIGLNSPLQSIEVVPGISLPTLAQDELFAYLCVHGASSAWFRLKWITDLAALLHRCDGIDRLYRRSQELGAARAPGQALLLADRLFNSLETAPHLRAELSRDGVNRLLAQIAFNQLAGKRDPREPTGRLFGTAAIHYSQLLLKPGLGFAVAEFCRQARAALMRR